VTETDPGYQDLAVDCPDAGVLRVAIDRPDVRGAYRSQTCRELLDALDRFAADDGLRALLLTGSDATFCSGGDLASSEEANEGHTRPLGHAMVLREGIHAVLRRLHASDKPVIAVVAGPAIAGGLALALACSMRIAGPRARFGDAATNVGLLPDDGGAWLFPRAMGLDLALRMTLLGEVYDAETALSLGLVTELHDDPMARGLELATTIAARAPLAMRTSVRLMRDGLSVGLDQSLHQAELAVGVVNESADVAEGVAAFKERRAPRFTGH
jgi:enoyl-CoA hydratase/carnithine racemase